MVFLRRTWVVLRRVLKSTARVSLVLRFGHIIHAHLPFNQFGGGGGGVVFSEVFSNNLNP
jgi:hypothetical protein